MFPDLDEKTSENIVRAHEVNLPELLGEPDVNFKLPWKNIAELFNRRCEEYSQKEFVTFYENESGKPLVSRLTYNEVRSMVSRTMQLMDKLKIPEHASIATVDLFNHSDTVCILLAAWCRGNLVVPINMEEDKKRIEFILKSSNVKAAFIRERHLKDFSEINLNVGVETLIQLGGEKSGIPLYGEEIKTFQEMAILENVPLKQPALLVYTSGTTGNPKGVILSHRLLYDVDGVVSFHGFGKRDVFLTAMRLFHVNAIITSMMATLFCGGRLVLMQKWNPKQFWWISADEKVTTTSVVPAMLADLNREDERIDRKYPELKKYFRVLICGAGTLKKIVAEEFIKKFGIKITHGWGMSETTCWGCWLPHDLSREEYNHLMFDFEAPSIGMPLRHNKMGIIDENGKVLREMEKGQIVIAGRNIMERYDNRPDANQDSFKFGFFETGDEGFYVLDSKKRPMFFITGRLKDIIERGGEKFSPYLMDEDLSKIEGVKNALVYGFSHKRFGQEIGVVFEMEEGNKISAEQVWKYCKSIGYSWAKTPKEIRVVDTIPKTSTGKETRKQFGELFKDCFEKHYKKPQWF